MVGFKVGLRGNYHDETHKGKIQNWREGSDDGASGPAALPQGPDFAGGRFVSAGIERRLEEVRHRVCASGRRP